MVLLKVSVMTLAIWTYVEVVRFFSQKALPELSSEGTRFFCTFLKDFLHFRRYESPPSSLVGKEPALVGPFLVAQVPRSRIQIE